jgi:hypothetical protein
MPPSFSPAGWKAENEALRLELLPYARYIQKNLVRGELLTDALEDLVTTDPPTPIKEHLGEALSHKDVPERFYEVLRNFSAETPLRSEREFLAILADAVKYHETTETIHALERFYESNLAWYGEMRKLETNTRLPRLVYKFVGAFVVLLPLVVVIKLLYRGCCQRKQK